jgi:hypothetical protein
VLRLVLEHSSASEEALLESVLDGMCPNVSSVRSIPAQIAVAFAPEDHLTESETGFPERSAEQRRRRQEALKHLRRERPELAAAAGKRKFGRGQKGSTFPWANTAVAVFDVVGPAWIGSQIAIMGAASPMRLGLQLQPGRPAFGRGSHPAALLEQTRRNAGNAGWWRAEYARIDSDSNLTDVEREFACAEWCLALWCVATAAVVAELFDAWSAVLAALPEPRRRPVVDCALRCSAEGWVSKLPEDLTSADPQVTALLSFRNPTPTPRDTQSSTYTPATPPRSYTPLIEVARERGWFKVDEQGVYR